MSFVTAQQLRMSLERLRIHQPLPIFTIPAMCQAGVTPKPDQPAADSAAAAAKADNEQPRFRGREEAQFVKQHFAVAGGPLGKPFYSPSNPLGASGQWVSGKYSGSTLQAQRRERRGYVFWQSDDQFFPIGDDWDGFAKIVREPAHAVLTTDEDNQPLLVPLFDLGVWLWRHEAFADAQAIVDRAKTELNIPAELVGTVYDDTIPAADVAGALGADALTDEDLAEVLNAVPPPPPLGADFQPLVEQIEAALTSDNVLVAPGVVARIVRAWAARDIVVLVGAGGTGKTTLAKGIVRALEDVIPPDSDVEVPVTEDFAVSDLVGYENLAQQFVDRPLTARILRSKSPLHPHVVLVEEINLAQVEAFLAPILHAIESGSPVALSGNEQVHLPLDTLVLATCNSPRDEPETRLPMSGPTKRRATAVRMPNLLHQEWVAGQETGLKKAISQILKREVGEIDERVAVGRGTWLDQPRRACLTAIGDADGFESTALAGLLAVAGGLLDSEDGRRWMTLGPLRDIVVQLAFAEGADQAVALVDLAIGKLLPQVQEIATAQGIADKLASLDTAGAVADAVAEMTGPGGAVRHLL